MQFAPFWSDDDNGSRPSFAAHLGYIDNPTATRCHAIHDVPTERRCKFVIDTVSCHDVSHFINYMNMLYCLGEMNDLNFGFKLLGLCLICLYIFMILGVITDNFFCPALSVLSHWLGLNENVAGVTLLAFGNGAPDLFTAFAHHEGDTELMYAELMGSAAFIIGFIGGMIVVLRPFTVRSFDLIRDTVFFSIAALWIANGFYDGVFTLLEANGTLLLYVLYLLVVLVDNLCTRKRPPSVGASDESMPSMEDVVSIISLEHRSTIRQFWEAVQPIHSHEWNNANLGHAAVMCLLTPIRLILRVCIPRVNEELPRNGWCKVLNVLQIILMPVVMICLKGAYDSTFFGVNIFVYVVPVLVGLAIAVFFTSTSEAAPRYHMAFAVFGSFAGSMCVISTSASELVSVLSTLGIVFNRSDSFVGLSVLSWGNSIGDLFSNVALARSGHQKMAFAACFGGPMFNSLLGIGVIFNLKIAETKSGPAIAREGDMGNHCNVFLCCILFFTLISVAMCGWQARRSIGVLMMSIHVMLITYAVLGEFGIMHPFGTDHIDDT